MDNGHPKSTPGPELAALRRSWGIPQVRLAERLGVHRITLRQWERAADVDPIRATRYQRALREIVAEVIGEIVAEVIGDPGTAA